MNIYEIIKSNGFISEREDFPSIENDIKMRVLDAVIEFSNTLPEGSYQWTSDCNITFEEGEKTEEKLTEYLYHNVIYKYADYLNEMDLKYIRDNYPEEFER